MVTAGKSFILTMIGWGLLVRDKIKNNENAHKGWVGSDVSKAQFCSF